MSAQNKTGYTLIELLLYVSIVGILLTATVMFVGSVMSARVKTQSIAEVEQQGTFIMDYISQTIRNADSITTPTAGNSAAGLTLAVPTGVLSPTVFDLSSGVVRVKEGAGSAIALSGSKVTITNLTFTNL